MRFKILLFAAMLLATGTLFAQYRITPTPQAPTKSQQLALASKLQTYSLYTIPVNQLTDWLEEDNFDLTLNLPGQAIEWSVERNTIALSPTFTAEEHLPSGVDNLNDRLTLLAYRAYRNDESKANAVLTYTDLGLEVNYNSRNQGTVRFASLYNLTYDANDIDVYILYRYYDVLATQSGDGSCKLNDKDTAGNNPTNPPKEGLGQLDDGTESSFCTLPYYTFDPSTNTTATCRIFQIAVDGDEEFRGNDAWGMLTFSRMFNNIMAAELPYFNEVDVSFQITRIRSFGGWGANGDPHPDLDFFVGNTFFQNRAEDYVDDLVTLNAGATPHDYVFGFTGVVSRAATGPGVLWGISNGIGTACSNNSASGLATQEAFDDGIAAVNTAHEIGHGYDALHPFGGACINECSPGGAANSFMCRTACAAVGTQNLTTMANETRQAWTNFVNGEFACFNNTNIGTIVGPNTICSSASYNWDAENVASGSLWTWPNTNWQAGPGLSISNAFAYNATVTVTTNAPLVSWVRMTLNQPTGCPIVLFKEVIVNAIPAFCQYNEACLGTFTGILDGATQSGTTVSNFQCLTGDCNNLTINNFGFGSFPSLYFIGNPGFYTIEYTLTNSCGSTTTTFWLNLISCFNGGGPPRSLAARTIINDSDIAIEQAALAGKNSEEVTQLSVYPNPAREEVTIQLQAIEAQRGMLSLYDGQGRQLKNVSLEVLVGLNQANLDLSDLPSGVYTIISQIDGVLLRRRLVKQ